MAIASDKKRVAITLQKDIATALEKASKKYGVNKSVLASMAVAEWLDEKKISVK